MGCLAENVDLEDLGSKSVLGSLGLKMAEEDSVADLKRRSFASVPTNKRASMATVLGKEGKFVAASAHEGKAIGVFTSGGDAQGLDQLLNYPLINFLLVFESLI